MDGQERQRLIKLYSEMNDEEIIEILMEDEEEYRQNPYEAYELVYGEAKKRGLDIKIREMKASAEELERQHSEKVELVVVYTANATEAGFAKNILEGNGITAFLRDEALGVIAPHYVSPVLKGAVKVVVDKRDFDEAKNILDVYFSDKGPNQFDGPAI